MVLKPDIFEDNQTAVRRRQEIEDRKYAQQLEEEERAVEETRRQDALVRKQKQNSERIEEKAGLRQVLKSLLLIKR